MTAGGMRSRRPGSASAVQRKLLKSLGGSRVERGGTDRVRGPCLLCPLRSVEQDSRFHASNKKSRQMAKPRPKYLDLMRIRLPLPGLVSILHRVSGALLFLLLPLVFWLWQQSLASQQTFDVFNSVVSRPLMKLVLLSLLWGYLHHLCAGIRHLALDLHFGTELWGARVSSVAVLVISIGLTLVIGVALW